VNYSLGQEISELWSNLQDENLDFDSRKHTISALEQVTVEDVNQKFLQLFFESPKRVNVKLNSQNHLSTQKD